MAWWYKNLVVELEIDISKNRKCKSYLLLSRKRFQFCEKKEPNCLTKAWFMFIIKNVFRCRRPCLTLSINKQQVASWFKFLVSAKFEKSSDRKRVNKPHRFKHLFKVTYVIVLFMFGIKSIFHWHESSSCHFLWQNLFKI